MDPLSIAASIGSLSGLCIVTVKTLGEIAGKFKDASKILQDISSEAKIVTISLSQLQNILVCDKYTILAQALVTQDIRSALDIALTGCRVTLACINDEIHSLTAKINTEQKLNFADRAKVVWKDDKFKGLLKQLRRQHATIAILQQGLQMKALADILPLLKSNSATIQKVADGTESLRGLYPQINAAKSFLESVDSSNRDESAFSIVSERQFEFDDITTSSQAYRRVLVAATYVLRNQHSGNIQSNEEASDVGPREDTLTKESGAPGTQAANQARRISTAIPAAATLPSAPDTISESHSNQRMTISDPNNFIQQLRRYVDRVEGELLNATDESVLLREKMREKDEIAQKQQRDIKNLEFQLQGLAEKLQEAELDLEKAELELDKALKEMMVDKYHFNAQLDELKIQTQIGESEIQRYLQKIKEMTLVHEFELAELKNLLNNSKNELRHAVEKSDESQEERNSLQIKLDFMHGVEAPYLREELQNLDNECKQLKWAAKKCEELIHNGSIAQMQSILLIPLQLPVGIDEHIKRRPIYEVVDAPETPEGWFSIWDNQQKKWAFVNVHTNESQFEKPSTPEK